MAEKKYSKKHEWVELSGDIVFTEVPDQGKVLDAGGEAAVVESVKAASDVYSPISGEVTESNDAIVGDPSLVNQDPEGNGWFFKLKVSNADQINELMSKEDYDKFVTENA